jgi:glycerophosphoryl diester phosphodiesterase
MPARPARAGVPLERIGHRGSPTQRPENTLEGFVLAVDQGANAVELDVHVTADAVVVVHHDPEVGSLPIRDTPWRALATLDVGGAPVPRLDAVISAIGDRARVYVELKGQDIEDVVMQTVRGCGGDYALHSFDHEAIARVRHKDAHVATGLLIDRGTTNPISAMRRAVARIRPRDVWPHWSLVSGDLMAAAAELGVRVIPWTVNTAESAKHLASLGVAGVCTDDIRMLANL